MTEMQFPLKGIFQSGGRDVVLSFKNLANWGALSLLLENP